MDNIKLVIGNKNYSSWSLRPWLAMKKCQLEFDEILVSLADIKAFWAKIYQYSPTGLVPCLLTDDVTVNDSLAIMEYLAESYPQLWPEDRLVRAQARAIAAEMHSGFNAIRSEMPMNIKAKRQIEPSKACIRNINRIIDVWTGCREEHQGKDPWLFGSFSIADAMFAPVVLRFETYGVELPEIAEAYKQFVLADADIQAWCDAAAKETDTIAIADVGVVRT